MDKREFKNKIYDELSKITKALGNSRRMEIIDLLAQGPFSVEKIAEQTGLSLANASQHLQVLKSARLVETSRKGNYIYYHLQGEKVFNAWRSLRELGFAQNAEAGKMLTDFYGSNDEEDVMSLEELHGKFSEDGVLIIDVRPGEEFERGHIKEAISIPIQELATRIKELPKNVEIIAYCRGPLCVYADEAVRLLRKKGYDARRLKEGFPDWKAMGFPAESNY